MEAAAYKMVTVKLHFGTCIILNTVKQSKIHVKYKTARIRRVKNIRLVFAKIALIYLKK